MHPRISEQIVMLYYANFEAATRFYGETLGLEPRLLEPWVNIYSCAERCSIGVLRAGATGVYHQAQERNAVMVSIVTDDVEAWYRRLRGATGVKFLKDIHDSSAIPIRTFLVEDPGGYALEFFQWREGSRLDAERERKP